jgi:general stress protein 26
MSTSRQQEIEKVAELIKDIDFAMMTTFDGAALHSRPMSTRRQPFDGTLWFFTEIDSPKVQEIRANPIISLAYSDPGSNNYVSISGTASVIQDLDKQKELWSPMAKAWFDGPDDPKLALIRVDVDSAETWDGPSSKLVQAFTMLKGAITGKSADYGDNETITLR